MKIAILQQVLQVAEDEVFTTVRELGFDGVELSFGVFATLGPFRGLMPPACFLLPSPPGGRGAEGEGVITDGPASLRRQATAHGVDISSVAAGYFNRHVLLDPRPEVRQKNAQVLSQLIDACAQAAIPVVQVPFYGANELRRLADADLLQEVLQPLAAQAAAQNVTLGLDTLLPAEDLKQLLERLASPAVKASYDVGNAWVAGRDAVAEIKLLGDRLTQVRLKDRDRREPFRNVPLGQGLVDWRATLAALTDIHYDRWLILDTPSGEDPQAAAKANLGFLRNMY